MHVVPGKQWNDSCSRREGKPSSAPAKSPSAANAAEKPVVPSVSSLVANALAEETPATSVQAEETLAVPPPPSSGLPCPKQYDRLIIEFCCGEDSRIGRAWRESRGCRVARITLAQDVTTSEGLAFVMDIIDRCDGPRTLLWAAMPCTGGSPWQHYNKQFPNARKKIREHIRVFHKIFQAFTLCAGKLVTKGGIVINEWPKGCSYWKNSQVTAAFADLGLRHQAIVHGCSLGLKSKMGKPIFKPWRLMSNSEDVLVPFHAFVCPRNHDHAPCAGSETKATESYTDLFAKTLHKSFKRVCNCKSKL